MASSYKFEQALLALTDELRESKEQWAEERNNLLSFSDDLKNQILKLSESSEEWKQKMDEMGTLSDDLKKNIEQLQDSQVMMVSERQEAEKALNQKIQEISDEVAYKDIIINSRDAELEAKRTEVMLLSQEKLTITSNMHSHEEYQELFEKCLDIQNKLHTTEISYEEVKGAFANQQTELQQRLTQYAESEQLLGDCHQQLTFAEAKLAETKYSLTVLQDEMSKLELDVAQKNQSTELLNSNMVSKDKLYETEDELRKLQVMNSDLQNPLASLEEAAGHAHESFEKERLILVQENSELRVYSQKLIESHLEEVGKIHAATASQIARFEENTTSEKDNNNGEVEKLMKLIAEMQSEYDRLSVNFDDTVKQLELAKDEIAVFNSGATASTSTSANLSVTKSALKAPTSAASKPNRHAAFSDEHTEGVSKQ